MTRERAKQLRRLIEKASALLQDEDALQGVWMFPEWIEDTIYTSGTRVRYGSILYRCEQTHTSQADWTPDLVPALWTQVAEPGEIPVWRQPTGAQDAYNTGDKVYYPTKEDSIYISTIDNNVWEPNIYGWELYI